MEQRKRKLTATLLAAAASATLAAPAHAVVYTEPGDAGQTLTTAANTGLSVGGTGTLTGVSGTIGTSTDADLYKFTINSTVTFTAAAAGGASSVAGNGNIDTSLFLFDSLGNAIIANDDQSNTNYQGSLTISLTAGTYYLGISLSGNEPVNSNNQLLFTVDQPTTGQRGAAAGLNPTTESTFNGNTSVAETGPYTIAISVPEPTTTAALAFGGLASLVFLRRLRRRQTV